MAANPSIQLGTDGNWAIKEDNLLAYKKDGTRFFNKEFDFTRGSLATFVDKYGLIKYSGVTDTELVTNGDFATDSDWTKPSNWTISGGKAIANGSSQGALTQTLETPVVGKKYKLEYTISNYISGNIRVYYGGVFTSFKTSNGLHSEIITSTSTDSLFQTSMAISFNGSIDNVSVKEIQTDVPRIDFTDDATGHLLLEPQSTNLVTYSEDFSHSSWTKLGSGTASTPIVTSNYATSPNGLKNASRLQCNLNGGTTINDQSIIYDTISGSGDTSAFVYVKSNTSSNQTFYLANTFNDRISAVATTQWQKLELNWNAVNNGRSLSIGARGGSGSDDTLDLLIWGAQVEALPYATSYIPTFGSTATRNGEVCNNSGSAQDFNDSEGVLYAEIAALADAETHRYISISDGTNNNRILIRYVAGSSNLLGMFAKIGNVTQVSQSINTDITINKKIAVKYKLNDYALWVDGVKVKTDTSASVPSAGTFNRLNFSTGSGADSFFEGKTKNVQVFKRAMSDDELYLLTVPQYQSYQEMATALNYTL